MHSVNGPQRLCIISRTRPPTGSLGNGSGRLGVVESLFEFSGFHYCIDGPQPSEQSGVAGDKESHFTAMRDNWSSSICLGACSNSLSEYSHSAQLCTAYSPLRASYPVNILTCNIPTLLAAYKYIDDRHSDFRIATFFVPHAQALPPTYASPEFVLHPCSESTTPSVRPHQ